LVRFSGSGGQGFGPIGPPIGGVGEGLRVSLLGGFGEWPLGVLGTSILPPREVWGFKILKYITPGEIFSPGGGTFSKG